MSRVQCVADAGSIVRSKLHKILVFMAWHDSYEAQLGTYRAQAKLKQKTRPPSSLTHFRLVPSHQPHHLTPNHAISITYPSTLTIHKNDRQTPSQPPCPLRPPNPPPLPPP